MPVTRQKGVLAKILLDDQKTPIRSSRLLTQLFCWNFREDFSLESFMNFGWRQQQACVSVHYYFALIGGKKAENSCLEAGLEKTGRRQKFRDKSIFRQCHNWDHFIDHLCEVHLPNVLCVSWGGAVFVPLPIPQTMWKLSEAEMVTECSNLTPCPQLLSSSLPLSQK